MRTEHQRGTREAGAIFEVVTQWDFGCKSYTARLPVFYLALVPQVPLVQDGAVVARVSR